MADDRAEDLRPVMELLRTMNDLVRDQMIVQLGLEGLPHQEIRKIVRVDLKRVTRIMKPLGKLKKNKQAQKV